MLKLYVAMLFSYQSQAMWPLASGWQPNISNLPLLIWHHTTTMFSVAFRGRLCNLCIIVTTPRPKKCSLLPSRGDASTRIDFLFIIIACDQVLLSWLSLTYHSSCLYLSLGLPVSAKHLKRELNNKQIKINNCCICLYYNVCFRQVF